jgi:AcrR family transcriptional regulator
MSRVSRPERAALSREYILDRALDLVDRDGLEAFTFRKLALEVGADPMAAYYYFPNKAALFDGIVEAIYLEVAPIAASSGDDGSVPPRDRILAAARSMRCAFLRHPRALPLVATRPASTPRMAVLVEAFLGLLAEAGVGGARALDAITCISVYTIGHALAQAGEPAGGGAPAGIDGLLQEVDRYPRLAAAAAHFADYDPDRQFNLGLAALVDGLLGAGG